MKIGDFYEKAKQGRFDLPLLQRGFVWKPQQIEYLWDSLARRFPFGAFIVDDLNAAKVQILDGQQRATAMMLGFGCDDEIFKLQAGRLRLFIDLFNPEKMFEDEDFSRHYIFRCISRSHPWGYQLKDNNKTLQTFDIRQALSVYSVGEKKYYDDDIKRFWPYDCYLPIPVELVMQAADVATFKEKARTYIEEHFGAFVGDDFRPLAEMDSEKAPTKLLREFARDAAKLKLYSLGDLYKKIHSIGDIYIPLLSVNGEVEVCAGEKNAAESGMVPVSNLKSSLQDDAETVFARINQQGTPIGNEELNYAFFKSTLRDMEKGGVGDENVNAGEIIAEFEKKSVGIGTPARMLAVAYQLFRNWDKKSSDKENDDDGIERFVVKYKAFRRGMNNANKKQKFIQFLQEEFVDGDMMENFRELLKYAPENNPNGMPYVILAKLTRSAPELVFAIMYRLKVDGFTKLWEMRDKVISVVLALFWFHKGERMRDYSKMLNNIWPMLRQEISAERCFSAEILQRAMLICDVDEKDGVVIPTLEDDKFKTYNEITRNRDFLLYAQREALYDWFGNEQEKLDDINAPYDFDHICPRSYFYRKRNLNKKFGNNFYDSNGNMRAWPFELNRHDSDNSMEEKFKPNMEEPYWQGVIKKYLKLQGKKDISKQLLQWSLCCSGWCEMSVKPQDLCKQMSGKNNNAKMLFDLMVERNRNIYKSWYDVLNKAVLDKEEAYFSSDVFNCDKESKELYLDLGEGVKLRCGERILAEDTWMLEFADGDEATFTLRSFSQESWRELLRKIQEDLEKNELNIQLSDFLTNGFKKIMTGQGK